MERQAGEVYGPQDGRPAERSQPSVLRVLVCHRDTLTAEGLARCVEHGLGAEVHTAKSLAEAVAAVAKSPPSVAVCSDRLDFGAAASEVAEELRRTGLVTPLLVVAESPSKIGEAREAGASGFVTLREAPEKLASMVAALAAGRSVLPDPASDGATPQLTARELEVLRAFNRGAPNKQVALELGISVSTVKTHAKSIYQKLDAHSRTSALYNARQAGLL